MTIANEITIARMVLIPVFVGFALAYGRGVSAGDPNESLRWAAVITFAVAALSDAVDGYVARHFHQESKLGVILDPLADKVLMLAAILTLTLSSWPEPKLPGWFAGLVVFKDVASAAGALIVKHRAGSVKVKPHWTGKACTFFQLVAIGWVFLDMPKLLAISPNLTIFPIAAAAAFTLIAGGVYIAEGVRQVSAARDQRQENAESRP